MRTIIKITSTSLACAFFWGCAVPAMFEPSVSVRDYPEVGVENTVSIGSSLILKGKVMASQGFDLLEFMAVKGKGLNAGRRFELSPAEFVAVKEDDKYTYFESSDVDTVKSFALGMRTDVNVWDQRIPTANGSGIRIHRTTGEKEAFLLLGTSIVRVKLPETLKIEKKMVTHVDSPGFQRELLYNGKSGSTIKVLYREFKNDMARPAFTQELTYDLSESDLIGFQEVRIRVADASNIQITYTVERGFDSL